MQLLIIWEVGNEESYSLLNEQLLGHCNHLL